MAYSHDKVTFDSTTNAYTSEIFGDLDRIASTSYGLNLLNKGTNGSSYIRFTGLLPNQIGFGPAFGGKQGVPPLPTVNIDYPSAQQTYWFNNTGEMVLGSVTLVIAHELAHAIIDAKDPLVLDPTTGTYIAPTDDQMNSSSFDFKGGAVKAQNTVANQLGLADQNRASYMASTWNNTTFAGYTFSLGKSYTDGATVNIVRFGDQQGAGQANIIDHSARTDNSKDLIFALGGDDYVDAGGGVDYIYGGQGNDRLYGGIGNDRFYAESNDGADLYHGGQNLTDPGAAAAARATDGKDILDFGKNSSGINPMLIQVGGTPLDGTYASLPDIDAATYVQQFDGTAIDTLISIETVNGTQADDTLDLRSLSAAVLADHVTGQGGLATVDLGEQRYETIVVGETTGGGDTLDMTHLDEAAIVHLDIATPKVWASADSSRRLTVKGVEDVYGSAHVDYIWGNEKGNYITSGEGEGGNRLFGMGGADKLVAQASGDILDGGAGNDILKLESDKATIVFGVGGGSDIVEFSHGEGNYTLRLNDLDPGDIEVIAGGRDVYYDTLEGDINGTRELPDGIWYQSLTIRVKATGDQITLLENGRNFGPNEDGSTTAINKGGIITEGFLDRVVFADGQIWNRNNLWGSASADDTWSYAPPRGYGNGQWSPENYLEHFTSTYLQADTDYVAGRTGASSISASALSANSSADQLAQAIAGFGISSAGEVSLNANDDLSTDFALTYNSASGSDLYNRFAA